MTYEPKPGEYEASLWPELGNRGKYWKQGKPMFIEGEKFWVNLYLVESENEHAPEYRLKLKKVDDSQYKQHTESNKKPLPDGEDIPF